MVFPLPVHWFADFAVVQSSPSLLSRYILALFSVGLSVGMGMLAGQHGIALVLVGIGLVLGWSWLVLVGIGWYWYHIGHGDDDGMNEYVSESGGGG